MPKSTKRTSVASLPRPCLIMKRLFCPKGIMGLGRFAPSALPHYKVPLRDMPRGVAQERIEKHTACDIIVSYAYDIILRTTLCNILRSMCSSTCGSMHVSHSRRPAGLTLEATIAAIQSGQTTRVWCCYLLCRQAAGVYSVVASWL